MEDGQVTGPTWALVPFENPQTHMQVRPHPEEPGSLFRTWLVPFVSVEDVMIHRLFLNEGQTDGLLSLKVFDPKAVIDPVESWLFRMFDFCSLHFLVPSERQHGVPPVSSPEDGETTDATLTNVSVVGVRWITAEGHRGTSCVGRSVGSDVLHTPSRRVLTCRYHPPTQS